MPELKRHQKQVLKKLQSLRKTVLVLMPQKQELKKHQSLQQLKRHQKLKMIPEWYRSLALALHQMLV
jgi:shikimate kinase